MYPQYRRPLVIRKVIVAYEDEHGKRGYIVGHTGPNTSVTATTEYFAGSKMGADIRISDLTGHSFFAAEDAQPALDKLKELEP